MYTILLFNLHHIHRFALNKSMQGTHQYHKSIIGSGKASFACQCLMSASSPKPHCSDIVLNSPLRSRKYPCSSPVADETSKLRVDLSYSSKSFQGIYSDHKLRTFHTSHTLVSDLNRRRTSLASNSSLRADKSYTLLSWSCF